MDNNNLQQQIDELKKKVDSLYTTPTIPLNVERSFIGRGFSNLKVYSGKVTLNVTGEYRLQIPGANTNSVPLAVHSTLSGSTPLTANIIPSATNDGYDIYIVGTATDIVFYVVFINPIFNHES